MKMPSKESNLKKLPKNENNLKNEDLKNED